MLLRYAGHKNIELFTTGRGPLRRIRVLPEKRGQPPSYKTVGLGFLSQGLIHGADLVDAVSADVFRKGLANNREALRTSLMLLAASNSIGLDGFITGGPLLRLRDAGQLAVLTRPATIARGTNVLSADQGLALLSLFLRSQGDFEYPLRSKGVTYNMTSGWFYHVLTRDLLHEGWRWYSHCVDAANQRLSRQGSATFARFSQALRARDRIQTELQLHLAPDFNEVRYHLDMLVVSLAGALDSAALVANGVYEVQIDRAQVGWRRMRWVRELRRKGPRLAGLVVKAGRRRAILDLLYLLRNLIHSEEMPVITLRGHREDTDLLALPEQDQAQFCSAACRAGGLEKWGVQEAYRNRYGLRVDRYVESLFPEIRNLLNEIMAETEVEKLKLGGGSPVYAKPQRDWIFPREVHRALPALAGLE